MMKGIDIIQTLSRSGNGRPNVKGLVASNQGVVKEAQKSVGLLLLSFDD